MITDIIWIARSYISKYSYTRGYFDDIYLKLTFSNNQPDEDRKNFRKIFMRCHVSDEKRDSPLRQQVVDAAPCHSR